MPSGRYLACRATPERLAAVAAVGDRARRGRAAGARPGGPAQGGRRRPRPRHQQRPGPAPRRASSPTWRRSIGASRSSTTSARDRLRQRARRRDDDLAAAYARLRQVGDVAARHGLVVALETHPNLISNGDVARRTMEAVAHPSIRVNYDTANVHYYNHGVDSVAELRKVLPYVAALHLKESKGAYESFDFPPLGQGIVDFPAIFRLLDEAGFSGPTTLEIEFLDVTPTPRASSSARSRSRSRT